MADPCKDCGRRLEIRPGEKAWTTHCGRTVGEESGSTSQIMQCMRTARAALPSQEADRG